LILEDIKSKLQEIDTNVFYGMVDQSMKEQLWDYIVFNRNVMRTNANKTGYSTIYSVHIVREDFIPEGLEESVINKMLEIDGMRLAGSDGTYTYVPKPNTNVVVEMFSIDFVKPKKV
jgi:hypothetical protein